MMVGIFWVAQGAMAFTPISHVLIPMVFEYIAADFGITVTYSQYTACFILCGCAFFVGWILLLRFVIRPDVKKLVSLDIDELKATVKPWTKQEKTILVDIRSRYLPLVLPDLIGLVAGHGGNSRLDEQPGQCRAADGSLRRAVLHTLPTASR